MGHHRPCLQKSGETGDWIISLFNDNAVYANKVWQYDKKTEKKVVLASGNEKLSIAIGKEKDGKRIFNIGGKKQMLSAITTNTITDYPTTDNTSFNTELKEGKAVVSGWLRYPKELLKDKLTVEIGCSNVATDARLYPGGLSRPVRVGCAVGWNARGYSANTKRTR